MQPKLNLEESALFLELSQSMYWPVLQKAMNGLIRAQESRVLQFNLQAGDRSLALELAKLEGQRTLQAALSKLAERKKSP